MPYDGMANESRPSMCLLCWGGRTGPSRDLAPLWGPAACMLQMPHPKFSFLGWEFFSCISGLVFPFIIFPSSRLGTAALIALIQGTMAVKFGLPDDEIDRLLSEAEARLSGNGSADALIAVSPAQPPAEAPASVAAPTAPTAGGQTAVPETKSEKLSVRVPQLAEKKKVRALLLFHFSSPQAPLSMMKVNPNSNDAGKIPLWDSNWHHNDFFTVIVTLRHFLLARFVLVATPDHCADQE